ncbi:hypothetical protein CBS101457_001988 [Exobasidium rhododendri]|nr:hypothetical protein CBS101457_001988 [Exobasidium rhododendri]
MGSHSVTTSKSFSSDQNNSSSSMIGLSVNARLAGLASELEYDSTRYHSGRPSSTSRSSMGDIDTKEYLPNASATILSSSSSSSSSPPPLPLIPSSIQLQHYYKNPLLETNEQMESRRRSSFEVGSFWKKNSVADAAVANFFDRVVQARDSRSSSLEGMTNSSSDRQYTGFPTGMPAQTASTSATTNNSSDSPYSIYTTLQEVIQNAAPPDTPYTSANPNPHPLTFSHPFALGGSEQFYSGSRTHSSAEEQGPIYHAPSPSLVIPSVLTGSYPGEGGGEWQNVSRSAASISSLSSSLQSSQMHLGRLPEYQPYRQMIASPVLSPSSLHPSSYGVNAASPAYLPGVAAPTTTTTTITATEPYSYSPQYIGSGTPSSSQESSLPSGQNTYFERRQHHHSPHHHQQQLLQQQQQYPPMYSTSNSSISPPLPTPISELSSNMFAMIPPSTRSNDHQYSASISSPIVKDGSTRQNSSSAFLSQWSADSPSQGEFQLHQQRTNFNDRQDSFSSHPVQEVIKEEKKEATGRSR